MNASDQPWTRLVNIARYSARLSRQFLLKKTWHLLILMLTLPPLLWLASIAGQTAYHAQHAQRYLSSHQQWLISTNTHFTPQSQGLKTALKDLSLSLIKITTPQESLEDLIHHHHLPKSLATTQTHSLLPTVIEVTTTTPVTPRTFNQLEPKIQALPWAESVHHDAGLYELWLIETLLTPIIWLLFFTTLALAILVLWYFLKSFIEPYLALYHWTCQHYVRKALPLFTLSFTLFIIVTLVTCVTALIGAMMQPYLTQNGLFLIGTITPDLPETILNLIVFTPSSSWPLSIISFVTLLEALLLCKLHTHQLQRSTTTQLK